MERKCVFVTGAGGYIGRHAVKALCDLGARVAVPVHHAEEVDSRAERLEVDFFSGSETLYDELGRPDAVLHLAWRDGFRHSSDAHMVNLPQHYLMIKHLLQGGLGQLAVMGSMHEIGYYEGEVNEYTPCQPKTLYGVAKDALRRSCFVLAGEFPVCLQWLRAYYLTGDDEKNHSVFTKILEAEKRGETAFPFTAGTHRFDFLPVEELGRQLAAAVMQREVEGVIECCSGRSVPLGEEAERFIRERGLNIRLDYGAFPEPAAESPALWGSNEKIQRIMQSIRERERGERP